MEHDQRQDKMIQLDIKPDKTTVMFPKEGAYEKKVVMSGNLVYPDEDAICFNFDFLDWARENTPGWNFVESESNIVFVFNSKEDAALFKLTYA